MSGSLRDLVIESLARLRLVCDATGFDPEDVRLEDLEDVARERLLDAATYDLLAIVGMGRRGEPIVATTVEEERAQARQAAFRKLVDVRRQRARRAAAALHVEQNGKPAERANGVETPACVTGNAQHKTRAV